MTINKLLKTGKFPVNNRVEISLIIKIFAYSAMNTNAKRPLLYSVLNPDTSSDSPSARSKGDRLVSAKLVITHINITGITINEIHEYMWDGIECRSILFIITKELIKISAIETSYEIVCATPRNAPSREYFEFEHHPEINTTYTFILDTHKKYITPNVMKKDGLEWG